MSAHYLLFYEKSPDYLERQRPLAAAHLAHLRPRWPAANWSWAAI